MSGARCDVVWTDARAWANDGELVLSDEERSRVAAVQDSRQRLARAVGFHLLRQVVSVEAAVPPDAVVVDRSCTRCHGPHGRPVMRGLDLEVSVTHSGWVVGVATSSGAAVGLDVEDPSRFSSPWLATAFLGQGEAASSGAELCRYWTRKEAVVKATGDGLSVGMANVTVSSPEEEPSLLAYRGRPGLKVQICDLELPVPYVAALAALTDRPVRVAQRWLDPTERRPSQPLRWPARS